MNIALETFENDLIEFATLKRTDPNAHKLILDLSESNSTII